ncbi:MAG: FMN-binding protein [Clostridia bacterium]|nr:FMN-binding protein [Clostridia bacterium]
MRNALSLVWKLLLICLVAGLVLGLINEVTKKPIEEQESVAADAARFGAFPGAKSFEQLKDADGQAREYYKALGANGELLGYVGAARAKGYGGDVEVVVGMDSLGKIVGAVIGGNTDFSETAGLGAKVKDASFAEQFIGLEYDGSDVKYSEGGGGFRIPSGSVKVESVASEGTDPDAVSGATYSSNAVIAAFNEACSELYKLITD